MTIPLLPHASTALFTDFDGTLVAIAQTPDGIQVPAHLGALAARLNDQLQGAFALITGRGLANLQSLFDISGFAAAGSHGAEWQVPRNNTRQEIDNTDQLFADLRPQIHDFAQQHELLLEDKRFSLALHFRAAPQLEASIDDFLQPLLQDKPAVKLIKGKCVREIKPLAVNKGLAIARFMQMAPFLGRTPVFLGDDTTDEDGFAWVNSQGGISIKVGEGNSAARYRLPDCEAVLEYLQKCSNTP